jgi:hypothetical protein
MPHDRPTELRARTYRPALGRFLTPDPIGLAGGPNLFGFAHGAPLAFRDPSGLSTEYTDDAGTSILEANGDLLVARQAGPLHLRAHLSGVDGHWTWLSRPSYARMREDALYGDKHPEIAAKHAAYAQGLQIVPQLGLFRCRFNPLCRGSKLLLDGAHLLFGDDDDGCDLDDDCAMDKLTPGAPLGGGTPPGGSPRGTQPPRSQQPARGGSQSRINRSTLLGARRVPRRP